jgi:hypothetical protein
MDLGPPKYKAGVLVTTLSIWKYFLKETGWKVVKCNRFIWLRMGIRTCKHSSEPLSYIQSGEFLDKLNDSRLIKDIAPWRTLEYTVLNETLQADHELSWKGSVTNLFISTLYITGFLDCPLSSKQNTTFWKLYQ